MVRFAVLFFAFLSGFSSSSFAQYSFDNMWLDNLAREAVSRGVSARTVSEALNGLYIDEKVLQLDEKQPESTISFNAYNKKIISDSRVKKGRAMLRENKRLLSGISRKYGVPANVIVALWGIETGYGANTGGFNIINSLATLAYQGRRTDFFRKELLAALRILDMEGMHPSALSGSWAGAMGQCQFMPSTFLNYAEDHNGDGRHDIWNDKADIFASMAAYLKAEGWKPDIIWGREVRLPKRGISQNHVGLSSKRYLSEWAKMGIRSAGGGKLPAVRIKASLIQPDGAGGRSFLVYDNFRVLMRWNRSTYFAVTVGMLADRINAAK